MQETRVRTKASWPFNYADFGGQDGPWITVQRTCLSQTDRSDSLHPWRSVVQPGNRLFQSISRHWKECCAGMKWQLDRPFAGDRDRFTRYLAENPWIGISEVISTTPASWSAIECRAVMLIVSIYRSRQVFYLWLCSRRSFSNPLSQMRRLTRRWGFSHLLQR